MIDKDVINEGQVFNLLTPIFVRRVKKSRVKECALTWLND